MAHKDYRVSCDVPFPLHIMMKNSLKKTRDKDLPCLDYSGHHKEKVKSSKLSPHPQRAALGHQHAGFPQQ